MTPQELRSAIDDSWPVEIRFLIERAAGDWSESLRHEKDLQSDLVSCVQNLSGKMGAGWFKRLRAKDWKITIEESELVCVKVQEGFGYFSAENKNHAKKTRYPETDEKDSSRKNA